MGRVVAGQTKTFGIELGSAANAGKFQVNPTISADDFRLSINGGSFAALTNTPTVSPAGGAQIVVVLAAAETTAAGAGGRIHLRASDSSGGEWQDLAIEFDVFATAEDTLVATVTTVNGLASGVITAASIASDAITAAKIADGAIDAGTFAAGAITATVIATGAIDADALATDAVTEIQGGLATATALATVDTVVDAILADTGTDGVVLSTAQMQALADIVLGRSVSNIDNTAATHSLYELIQAVLESNTSTGSWVIYKTNGSTTFNTRTLATDADAVPIVGVS